jgi:hypothetical protein
VMIIHFKGLTDILDSSDITAFSGPYLQLKLFPSDPIAGEQIQRSSFKPESVNPLWVLSLLAPNLFETSKFYRILGTTRTISNCVNRERKIEDYAVDVSVIDVAPFMPPDCKLLQI